MGLLNKIIYKMFHSISHRIEDYKIKEIYSVYDIDESVRFFNPLKLTLKGNIKIGKGTYINSGKLLTGTNSKIIIGEYCAIGHNVTMSSITHSLKRPTGDNRLHEEGDVIIGNHVWIGSNVFIKNGVKIEDYAIIGANSFVNKNVDSFSIVGGVPAKFIKTYIRD